jgi:hypothetical protein
MKTYTVKCEFAVLEVAFSKHAIDIKSDHAFDISTALKAVDTELANELREQFPKDYAFIVDDEDYGSFLTLGSPQIEECGWHVDYHTESGFTSLSVTGIDQ